MAQVRKANPSEIRPTFFQILCQSAALFVFEPMTYARCRNQTLLISTRKPLDLSAIYLFTINLIGWRIYSHDARLNLKAKLRSTRTARRCELVASNAVDGNDRGLLQVLRFWPLTTFHPKLLHGKHDSPVRVETWFSVITHVENNVDFVVIVTGFGNHKGNRGCIGVC